MTALRLTEIVPLSEAGSSTTKSGRMSIQVISPGWGSSGYYSPEVCEAAAPLFTVGTQMFIDHPTPTEEHERPVRSVRDIAAVITEGGRWDATKKAVIAECQVVGPYKEVLTDLAEHIGLSIRGSATDIVVGEAEGRTGPIIEGLADLKSVDFVTRAGRGGRVLQVLESANADEVTARAIAHGVAEATADERRQQLSDVIRTAYAGEKTYAWVQDFDDDQVWFEASAENERSRTWQQGYTVADDDMSVSLDGERIEVRAVRKYVPVTRPGSTTTTESQEDIMPNIEEAELSQLREASGRVPTLESERDTAVQERDTLRTENQQLRAERTAGTLARTRVTEANGTLPTPVVDRIVAEATRTVPLTEAGELDTAALDTAVDAARTAEETYLAGLAQSAGVGTVLGFGGTGGDHPVIETKDIDEAVGSTFGRTAKEA